VVHSARRRHAADRGSEALSRFYLDPVAERRAQAEPRVGRDVDDARGPRVEIADYVSYLEHLASEVRRHLSGAGPRIVVLGFSQGTATVCRWLASSDLRADQIVLWAAGSPRAGRRAWSTRLHGRR
jgi:alpha-beta hydrolase superfamily lysophospholipase